MKQEWGQKHMEYTINFMGRGWKIGLEEGRYFRWLPQEGYFFVALPWEGLLFLSEKREGVFFNNIYIGSLGE